MIDLNNIERNRATGPRTLKDAMDQYCDRARKHKIF